MKIFMLVVVILATGFGHYWQWRNTQAAQEKHRAEMQLAKQKIAELEAQSGQRDELTAFLAWRARLIGRDVTAEDIRKGLSDLPEPSLELMLAQLRTLGVLPADNEIKLGPVLYPKEPVRLEKLIEKQKQRVSALEKKYPHNAWPGHGSMGYFSHPMVIAEREILYALYAYKHAPDADGDITTASLDAQLALAVAQSLMHYRQGYDDWDKIAKTESDVLVPEKLILGVPPRADQ
jgi:hypothetical protein